MARTVSRVESTKTGPRALGGARDYGVGRASQPSKWVRCGAVRSRRWSVRFRTAKELECKQCGAPHTSRIGCDNGGNGGHEAYNEVQAVGEAIQFVYAAWLPKVAAVATARQEPPTRTTSPNCCLSGRSLPAIRPRTHRRSQAKQARKPYLRFEVVILVHQREHAGFPCITCE